MGPRFLKLFLGGFRPFSFCGTTAPPHGQSSYDTILYKPRPGASCLHADSWTHPEAAGPPPGAREDDSACTSQTHGLKISISRCLLFALRMKTSLGHLNLRCGSDGRFRFPLKSSREEESTAAGDPAPRKRRRATELRGWMSAKTRPPALISLPVRAELSRLQGFNCTSLFPVVPAVALGCVF